MSHKQLLCFYRSTDIYTHWYFSPVILLLSILHSRCFTLWYEICIVVGMMVTLLYLSTFWSIHSYITQCFTKITYEGLLNNHKNCYIFYENKLCRIHYFNDKKDTKNNYLYFMHNNSNYIIQTNSIATKVSINFEKYSTSDLVNHNFPNKYYSHFPKNNLSFPPKTFLSLYKEQITAPLFCFSTFSSVLTLFDDYILNSLFSITMGFIVEGAMVVSRLVTLRMFQSYESRSVELTIVDIKSKERKRIISSELQPGDIVIIEKEDLLNNKNNSTNNSTNNTTNNLTNSTNNRKYLLPADFLILSDTAVVNESMLSGEATPLVKNNILPSETLFSYKKNKSNIIYSGTELLKIVSENNSKSNEIRLLTLKTSFDTEQGILLNTMLSSTTATTYDTEALKFVFILSIIAVIASGVTICYSNKRGYPLFLDILILFTNAIPFELPLEMGASIQMAVRQLYTKNIYCLEPRRIQLAGKVDVVCMDKTGTLIEEKIELTGVVGKENISEEKYNSEVNLEEDNSTNIISADNIILSACCDITKIDGKMQGDPLDMAIYEVLLKYNAYEKVERIKEYSFSATKRRQSVIIRDTTNNLNSNYTFVTKGAPEEIEKYLKEVSPTYTETYERYSRGGYRVIAVAKKEMDDSKTSINNLKTNSITDEQYELEFVAFLLFSSKLKHGAVEIVRELRQSNHEVVMITGDNKYTAESVSQKVGILRNNNNNEEFILEGEEIDQYIFNIDMLKNNASKTSKNITIDKKVYARANPAQKEKIIQMYKNIGKVTMMVGDGTNDVGALKAADVGVAILECSKKEKNENKENSLSNNNRNNLNNINNLSEQLLDDTAKPGDASIAAPFTVKSHSLLPILQIILQGRTSACTTIQMYKILALNSLISAFTLSFLDLFDIKFSEKQMLSMGVLNSLAFNAISRGKTLKSISKKRVVGSIFNKWLMGSVGVQSVIHTGSFMALVWIFKDNDFLTTSNNLTNDSSLTTEKTKFKKGMLNTAVYALSMCQTIATFVFNYIGRPFREDIVENAMLMLSIVGMLAIPLNILTNIQEEINEQLDCVDLGSKKGVLLALCGGLMLGTFVVDKVSGMFY